MLRICSVFVLAFALAGPGAAQTFVQGIARVVDGDTLEISGQRIRLFGIDAPELGQSCTGAAGQRWACGKWAKAAVAARLAGNALDCTARDTDRYGRMVALCSIDGRDLGRQMVRGGLAFAYVKYSTDYLTEERAARHAKRGLWAGEPEAPWVFRARAVDRKAVLDASADTGPADCLIKGNISGSGRIYHLPGGRWYEKVRIAPAKGERWFCTTAEARAAGWREALG